MQTHLAEAIAVGLLLMALRRQPYAPTLALAASFLLGCVLSEVRHGAALVPLLIALDAAMVAVMALMWRRYRIQRAQVIGSLSMGRIAVGLLYAVHGATWYEYALACNVAFFAQILIAGGMADGVLAWLGNSLARIRQRGLVMVRFDGWTR